MSNNIEEIKIGGIGSAGQETKKKYCTCPVTGISTENSAEKIGKPEPITTAYDQYKNDCIEELGRS